MSRAWILAVVVAAMMVAPSVTAGTADAPELTDPAGDSAQAVDCTPPSCISGPYEPNAAAAGMVDILAAWVHEAPNGTGDGYSVVVRTAAAPDAGTQITVNFVIEQGNTSVFTSTATGQSVAAQSMGSVLESGPINTTVWQNGADTWFNFTYNNTAVSGGDVLTNLIVDTTREEVGTGTLASGTQIDSDSAPNAGVETLNYTFWRSEIVPGVALFLVNATLNETIPRELAEGRTTLTDLNASEDLITRDRVLFGDSVSTYAKNATITYNLLIANNGTDLDTYNLTLLMPGVTDVNGTIVDGSGQMRTLTPENVTLAPGTVANVTLTIALLDADAATYASVIEVLSARNATTSLGVQVERMNITFAPVEPVEPTKPTQPTNTTSDGRDPVGGLGFLTPAAEALGFDEVFGDWAELVLLALILLVVILLIFLILALIGGRWVSVKVSPKTLTAGPGETAEFSVQIRNRKNRFRGALARFEQDAGWKTGVLLRNEDGSAIAPLMEPGSDRELGLGAKNDEGNTLEGTLRVKVPEDAGDHEQGHVSLNVVPVGDDGHERPRKGGRARIKVISDAPGAPAVTASPRSQSVPVRLSTVEHVPQTPAAGDVVTTTATLANDSDSRTLRLRVVLQLDGEDGDEEIVEVPPHAARAVVFRWLADEGSNRVRVQVFEAD